jgi:hypothetical protein
MIGKICSVAPALQGVEGKGARVHVLAQASRWPDRSRKLEARAPLRGPDLWASDGRILEA